MPPTQSASVPPELQEVLVALKQTTQAVVDVAHAQRAQLSAGTMPPTQLAPVAAVAPEVPQVLANLKQSTQAVADLARAQRAQADAVLDNLLDKAFSLGATAIAMRFQTLNSTVQPAQPGTNTAAQALESVTALTTETMNPATEPKTMTSSSIEASHVQNASIIPTGTQVATVTTTSGSGPASNVPTINSIRTGTDTAVQTMNLTVVPRAHKRNISMPTAITDMSNAPSILNTTGTNGLAPPGAGHRRLQSIAATNNIVPNQPVMAINGLPAIASGIDFVAAQQPIAANANLAPQATVASTTNAAAQAAVAANTTTSQPAPIDLATIQAATAGGVSSATPPNAMNVWRAGAAVPTPASSNQVNLDDWEIVELSD